MPVRGRCGWIWKFLHGLPEQWSLAPVPTEKPAEYLKNVAPSKTSLCCRALHAAELLTNRRPDESTKLQAAPRELVHPEIEASRRLDVTYRCHRLWILGAQY